MVNNVPGVGGEKREREREEDKKHETKSYYT